MAKGNRATCRRCIKHRSEVGEISWAGYCGVCGPIVREQANDDLHYHRGPGLLRWRRAMAKSIGAVLEEDIRAWLDAQARSA